MELEIRKEATQIEMSGFFVFIVRRSRSLEY